MFRCKALLMIVIGLYSGTAFPEQNIGERQTSEVQNFRIESVADGFDSPWAMAFLPGGDLLVTDRSGSLNLIADGKRQSSPVGGVPEVRASGQGGLLDLELHPDFSVPGNGWIYLSYASPKQRGEKGRGANTALMRARLRNNQLVDQELLFKAQPNYSQTQHYGGRIVFDGEGNVYLTVGDRGGRDEVQQLDNARGKIFRLHDDGSIPEDNPFLGTKGATPSTWSTGHRNPQGFAVHPETGVLWAHEHGPRGGDELNIIEGGKNYGWPIITYGVNYSGSQITPNTAMAGMEQPVTYWVPSIAPSGMAFLTGDTYAGWDGDLFIGSLKFQRVYRLVLDGQKVVHQESLLNGIGRVRAIEQGPDGFLYIAVEKPGRIVRLIPVE